MSKDTWVGKVVDVNDPHKSGRLRVRIFGHYDDVSNIPDSSLPWCIIKQPVTSAAHGKMGHSPVGAVVGSIATGYWLDPIEKQYPVVDGFLGKSGDTIPGVMENGAPKIDTTVGSIPPSAVNIPNNPYTQVSGASGFGIKAIDAGTVFISSLSSTVGKSITKAVESNMLYAKYPTTASHDKKDSSDILDILNSVDPTSSASVMKCLLPNMMTLKDLLNLTTSLASTLKDILVKYVQQAILAAAKRLGLFKILSLLNLVAQEIVAIGNLLHVFDIKLCGKNIVNQKLFDDADYIFAKALSYLNEASGFIVGGVRGTEAFVSQQANSLFNSMVAEPLASVASGSDAIPSNLVNTPPDSYVRRYYGNIADDPYPGYVTYVDPQGNGSPVYIPRNGEPNYSSPVQHTSFMIQNTISSALMTSVMTGNFSSAGMQGIMKSAFASAQIFAVSAVLGIGFSLINSSSTLASTAPKIYNNVSNVFQPSITSAVNNVETATNSLNKFMQSQSLLAMHKQKIKTGLN